MSGATYTLEYDGRPIVEAPSRAALHDIVAAAAEYFDGHEAGAADLLGAEPDALDARITDLRQCGECGGRVIAVSGPGARVYGGSGPHVKCLSCGPLEEGG